MGAIDGHELGDRVAVDSDAKVLARFDAAQQTGGLISQLTLWNLRSHRATA